MKFTLNINKKKYDIDVDPAKPLLWVLREDIGLMGTKYGCGTGACGACTVLLNDVAHPSCSIKIEDVGSSEITTVEGLDSEIGRAVKEAWLKENVSQCGFCQPGQVVKAAELLSENPNPTEQEINTTITNICRCGTYQRTRTAVKTASDILNQRKG